MLYDLAVMQTQPNTSPMITLAGQGRVVRAFGDEVEFLIEGKHNAGAFCSFMVSTPPGGGPPPHSHAREDEWFHVLEGTVSFYVDGKWIDAVPGDTVYAPKAGVHAFRNNTDQATRMLVHAAPAGFEDFFDEAAAEFAKPGGPDMAAAVAIAAKHGIRFAEG